MSNKQTPASFWARVDRTGDGCWEWQGACNATGYGAVSWDGKTYCTHRVAAWLEGMVVSPSVPKLASDPTHVVLTCKNFKCCRPSHFKLGVQSAQQVDYYAQSMQPKPKPAAPAKTELPPTQRAALRTRYRAGESVASLAQDFGVSFRYIAQVTQGVALI